MAYSCENAVIVGIFGIEIIQKWQKEISYIILILWYLDEVTDKVFF